MYLCDFEISGKLEKRKGKKPKLPKEAVQTFAESRGRDPSIGAKERSHQSHRVFLTLRCLNVRYSGQELVAHNLAFVGWIPTNPGIQRICSIQSVHF